MLIVNKKAFSRGMALMLSFIVLFVLIISPIFKDENGKALTGLQYADAMFNSLSKGSSYFIPGVMQRVKDMQKKEIDLTVTVKKPAMGQVMVDVLQKAGITAGFNEGKLSFKGDLGTLLEAALADADKMYHNDGAAVSQKYNNMPPTDVMSAWWYMLQPSIKALQKQGSIPEASLVDNVVRRAVEPGNNFYSVPATKVMDHVFLMSGLLLFYVLYTLWYGFAIFEIFDGIGLTMSKSKVKQEG